MQICIRKGERETHLKIESNFSKLLKSGVTNNTDLCHRQGGTSHSLSLQTHQFSNFTLHYIKISTVQPLDNGSELLWSVEWREKLRCLTGQSEVKWCPASRTAHEVGYREHQRLDVPLLLLTPYTLPPWRSLQSIYTLSSHTVCENDGPKYNHCSRN